LGVDTISERVRQVLLTAYSPNVVEGEFSELLLLSGSRKLASSLGRGHNAWGGTGYNPPGKRGKGGVVQIFTKYVTQETITDREKVMEVRQVGGKQLQEILQSGKVRASGVFADARGGFFVLEVDSSEEVFDLFAPVLDYIRIETHPLTTVEKLAEFLERDTAASS
jgi:uncharacterized protein YciI